jgi:excisionase family DNA binding protein
VIEVTNWLTLSEAAQRLGVSDNRVRQLVRDGQLLSARNPTGTQIPADFIDEQGVVKGLAGTITLLRDSGYTDAEALEWIFRPDETLPGTPIQALRENRGKEVKRRAQAAGF